MKRSTYLTKVAALMLFVLTTSAAWAADDETREALRPADSGRVRGAWKLTLIPEQGGPPPFLGLMVLGRDGTVVETDAGPPFPQQFSPGIGEWSRGDDGNYVVSYTQLQYDDNQVHIGNFDALLVVTIDESGKKMTGTLRVRFFDLNDDLQFEGHGTLEGARLSVN